MQVSEIQKLIRDTTRQKRWEWENNVIEKSLKTLKAIQDLHEAFERIKDKSITVHYRTILTMRNQIHEIMPGVKSKFQDQRMKLIHLVDEAEKAMNSDVFRVEYPKQNPL